MIDTPLINSKGLKILHLNAQSIRNKFPLIKREFVNQGIEILLFSELQLTEPDLDQDYVIPGYNLHRVDRARPINAGGVCAYTHESISCNPEELRYLNKSTIDIEVQWLKITKSNTKQIVVANIYCPSEGNKANFIQELRVMLGTIDGFDNLDVG